MSKPNKQKKVANFESLRRMNYLYQASNLNVDISPELSRHYTDLMLGVGQKSVQRIDIPLKRTICKKCHNLLLPGITSTVRIKKKQIRWKCNKCNHCKLFNCSNPDYQTWTQTDESIVEIIDYNTE